MCNCHIEWFYNTLVHGPRHDIRFLWAFPTITVIHKGLSWQRSAPSEWRFLVGNPIAHCILPTPYAIQAHEAFTVVPYCDTVPNYITFLWPCNHLEATPALLRMIILFTRIWMQVYRPCFIEDIQEHCCGCGYFAMNGQSVADNTTWIVFPDLKYESKCSVSPKGKMQTKMIPSKW